MWQTLHNVWTASIRRQLMLGIALVHAVLMTIFVFDLVSRQNDFLIDESRKQASALAQTLAANGSSWVLADDFIGIEEVINSQRAYPGLRYAMFIDTRGKVLGYTDKAQVGRYVSDPVSQRLLNAGPATQIATQILHDSRLLMDIAHPIRAGEQHIGWARVGISRAGIASNIEIVTTEGLLYTLAAIGVGLVFAWLMSRSLTADIHRLALFSQRIRAGLRNQRCDVSRPDELGELSLHMNNMLEALADSEQQLQTTTEQAKASEERLRYALEGANDGLWDWNILSGDVYFSPRWKQMIGYQDDELANRYDTWESRVHPDDLEMARSRLEAHLADRRAPFEILHRLRHQDGSWRWIRSRGRALRDPDGRPLRMVGTHVDVTEEKILEETLYAERERALVTLRSIGDGVITTRADGTIDYLNPVASELTGWGNDEAHGRSVDEVFVIVNEITRNLQQSPIERCLSQNKVVGLGNHSLLVSREGREVSIEDSAAPIRNDNGEILGAVLVFHDVTQARLMQREIEHQAMHDSLTGLWSRTAFDRRLADLTEQAMAGDGHHALVYIDLDQFKVVNDTVGHLAGDELLKQVALLMGKTVRESDILARLGGDEFGLLLVGCGIEQAVRVAEKMRSEIAEFRFTWEGHSFQVGASLGIALIDQDLPDPNALSLADLACYSAKDQGRNRLHVYQPDDQELSERRSEMQWVTRVKHALDHQRLVLYSQRIAPLGDNGEADNREILIRMLDADDNIVPPAKFIPAAERYGLMSRVDAFVVTQAFRWLGLPENQQSRLSVNLSGRSLGNQQILQQIEGFLDKHPQLGAQLCFEITETAAIGNLREAMAFIDKLKRRQVSFALDDFGSGLSSFSYLKTLPVDYLKIDGCFVRDLIDDPVDAAMVEAIAKVSREMGIKTIAEFVENERIRKRLVEIGVDYAQGYGIERPRPLDLPSAD